MQAIAGQGSSACALVNLGTSGPADPALCLLSFRGPWEHTSWVFGAWLCAHLLTRSFPAPIPALVMLVCCGHLLPGLIFPDQTSQIITAFGSTHPLLSPGSPSHHSIPSCASYLVPVDHFQLWLQRRVCVLSVPRGCSLDLHGALEGEGAGDYLQRARAEGPEPPAPAPAPAPAVGQPGVVSPVAGRGGRDHGH